MNNIPNIIKTIKIIKSSIYFLSDKDIRVFDLNLNFINSFGSSDLSNPFDLLQIQQSDYIYVIDKDKLKIFSWINFKYIDSILTKNNFYTTFTQFFIPKNKIVDNDNSKFLCTMNDFKRHLLFNPHILPCGNISCLEFIFDN